MNRQAGASVPKKRRPKAQRVIDAVPTSWLDPLLSGPNSIGQPPYDCRHIEQLLRGVQDRVRAAVDALEKP